MKRNMIDNRTESLEKIFNNVNVWLHFAEAKNAAILAFNIAAISAINEFNFAKEIQFISYILQIAVFISTIIALASFSPVLKYIELRKMKKERNINLLLFSDIACFSDSNEYLKKIYKEYWNEQGDLASQIEKDFCFEIYENSKIAVKKYQFFRVSLWIDIGTCIVIIMLLIAA